MVVTVLPLAGLQDFFDAVDQFASDLAHIKWGALAIALLCFTVYLSLRARASFNILRAAYPTERFRYKDIWAAYIAGYGFNSVIPARGGDVIRLFLTKTSVPRASYPAVGASFFVENVFDLTVAVFILTFAFTQGVFPKPPEFADLGAFDLSFFAQHPKFALFTLTALAILFLASVAILSARVRAFWERVKQGLTILYDRRRYFRQAWLVQLAGYGCRFTAFWFLLEAFHIGGSVKNVLLVLGVNAVAAAVPFTPGGAGVQQALLVKVFGNGAAAYSVGQQIAIAAWTFGAGFLAIAIVFRVRSFKEIIRRGREDRERDRQMRSGADPEAAGGVAEPAR